MQRECSIQRRHQKVIEECPSPFVERHPELRQKLGDAAVRLAESIQYGSAGTIEYLVDDKSGDFFFLEMNTRLQVEHGITELCYGVDLVELMLRQADAQLAGKGGLDGEALKKMQPEGPQGAAIEARVYAENPLKDYAPSPGLLQKVEWKDVPGSRVDTWVLTGSRITPNYGKSEDSLGSDYSKLTIRRSPDSKSNGPHKFARRDDSKHDPTAPRLLDLRSTHEPRIPR
jgi:urea carboxylase